MKDETITTVATHYIKEDSIEEFRQWLERIKNECSKFEGYIDSKLIEPLDGQSEEHVSIFRFNNYKNLKKWLSSEIHNNMVQEVASISYKEIKIAPYKSLEFWFTPKKRPSTFLMSVVTYVGLLPLVIVIPPLFENYLDGYILTSVATAASVILMSYVVMPGLNYLLKDYI